MPDIADTAAELEAEHLARSLAAARAAVPAGAPGECDNCGDHFARLVGGLCGFCRDGRRPCFGQPAPIAPTPITTTTDEEEDDMPAYKDGKYLSVPADGALLASIQRYADGRDLALGAAAAQLAEAGLLALALPEPAAIASADEELVDLATLSIGELLDELGRRIEAGVPPADYDQALDRAAAAEAKLATIAAALGPVA